MTPLRIALAGMATLAVAMGIGRFAFTPILPMMLHDGVLDLARGSWLASANYAGYLAGAVLATIDPWLRQRFRWRPAAAATSLVRLGLAATALLTVAMAWPWPAAWPALRFAAGVVSAYVLLQSAAWCLAQLAARGRPALGGVMFAGPGVGIVASGLIGSAMVSWQWRASTGWIVFGLLAAVLSAAVWHVFRRENEAVAKPRGDAAAGQADGPLAIGQARHGAREVAVLTLAYGISGFGYIVTATFLPVIARAAIAGSPLIDLFWPIFGGGVVCGALLSARVGTAIDRRHLLAAAYVMQACGIGLGVAWPTEAGFALGSLLLGFPFTTLTLFALQEARRLRPQAAPGTMGLVTTAFALGQVLGPPMVAALLAHSAGDAHAAFQRSLVIAASALLVGAAMFVASARVWPAHAGRPPA